MLNGKLAYEHESHNVEEMARAINPIFAKMVDSGHAEAAACFLEGGAYQ